MGVPDCWRKELARCRLKLSEFVEIESTSAGSSTGSLPGVRWKKVIPRSFPEAIRRALRFIFYQNPPPPSGHRFCLCMDIPVCRRKEPEERENFLCPKFAFGVCVSATYVANNGQTMPIEAIGALSGMTKQGFGRHVAAAQKMMIRRILADSELADFCRDVGVGRERESQCG